VKEKTYRIKELVKKLNQCSHEYYNLNKPSIPDYEYNRLFDELQRLEYETGLVLSDSPTQNAGYLVMGFLQRVENERPLLSLDKTKHVSDLIRFAYEQFCLLMLKYDGLTIKLTYENGELVSASTRGNGTTGEDVTHNARTFRNIPLKIPYMNRLVITGEALIHLHDFETLVSKALDDDNEPYKNARNLAAGSVRCLNSAKCKDRRIFFYPFNVLEGFEEYSELANSKFARLRFLLNFGFQPSLMYYLFKGVTESELNDKIESLRSVAKSNGIPIDGCVITYDDIEYSESKGRTGHHYRDGLAFKFADDIFETVLREIIWNTTRTGEIVPVASFDTVSIDGCDVSKATLHNINFIEGLELKAGCRILVSKRNMIIPHIEDNLDRGTGIEPIPGRCPSCGSSTQTITRVNQNKQMVKNLFCKNPNCKSRFIYRMAHFVSKKAMDIEGLSDATLDKFYEYGWLEKITDLYSLEMYKEEITALEGFGEKSFANLMESINRSRITSFEKFLVSVDIPMLGSTYSKELKRYFNDDIMLFFNAIMDGFDFSVLEGCGPVLNQNIHEWFSKEENITFWKELLSMMEFKKENVSNDGAADSPFNGKTVVVTGKVGNLTRDEVHDLLARLGAKAGSSVSKKTDYLIVGDKAGSKLTKANELGVKVIDGMDFLEMVGA